MQDIRSARRTAGLTCTAVLLAACAGRTPAQTAVHFQGVPNFRDVGGYRTVDGHTIRHGLLYRSGQLSATTPADQQKLAALGIRYEIDLRSGQERKDQPSRWGANAPNLSTPFHYVEDEKPNSSGTATVAATASKMMSPITTAGEVNEMMQKFYGTTVTDRAQEMGQVLRDLASEDAPALLHCTGGKDRTGLTVAMLMTLLGAPRDAVYEEYLKSNASVGVWYEDMKTKAQAANQQIIPFELFKARAGASSAWLDEAFTTIDHRYGSFEQYAGEGLKLTAADTNRLKARFLQK